MAKSSEDGYITCHIRDDTSHLGTEMWANRSAQSLRDRLGEILSESDPNYRREIITGLCDNGYAIVTTGSITEIWIVDRIS